MSEYLSDPVVRYGIAQIVLAILLFVYVRTRVKRWQKDADQLKGHVDKSEDGKAAGVIASGCVLILLSVAAHITCIVLVWRGVMRIIAPETFS